MSISPSVKVATMRLQRAYKKGVIEYPRTNLDLVKDSNITHAPMPEFDKYSVPYNFSKKRLTKKTALLYLNIKKLVTPSQANDMAENLDNFFDDELNMIRKEFYLEHIKLLERFLKEHEMSVEELASLLARKKQDVSLTSISTKDFSVLPSKNVTIPCYIDGEKYANYTQFQNHIEEKGIKYGY